MADNDDKRTDDTGAKKTLTLKGGPGLGNRPGMSRGPSRSTVVVEKRTRLLLKDLANLRHRESSVRLHERAERPDRAGDENAISDGRLPGEADPFAVDLLERVRPLVGRQLDPVGVPRVRRDDPGAGVDVVLVDLSHRLRIGDVQRRLGLVGRRAAGNEKGADRAVGEEHLFGDCASKIFLHERQTPPENREASSYPSSRRLSHLFLPPGGAGRRAKNPDLAPGEPRRDARIRLPWAASGFALVAKPASGRSLTHSRCGRCAKRRPRRQAPAGSKSSFNTSSEPIGCQTPRHFRAASRRARLVPSSRAAFVGPPRKEPV